MSTVDITSMVKIEMKIVFSLTITVTMYLVNAYAKLDMITCGWWND